tara:strand:+ start:1703 stop:2140 length:438 start_codon:yes stop_codon:yes gene_type:complete
MSKDITTNESDNTGSNTKPTGNQILNVGNYHYHGNDLKELRLLAEASPDIAEQVLQNQEKADARFNNSHRFGLCATIFLVVIALVGLVTVIIFDQILSLILLVVLVLAMALMIRVVLTGHWSDTSWFGRTVGLLAKSLGSSQEQE